MSSSRIPQSPYWWGFCQEFALILGDLEGMKHTMGNVLVRADDHAVLLVHELVHLGTYLPDGGLHLLAVALIHYTWNLTTMKKKKG